MAVKLTSLDKKIVDLLTVDGRMPCKEMARRIAGASERVIRYRLNRLIEAGVIGVSAVVDPQKIGYPVIADVFIEAEPSQVVSLAKRLTEFDNITYVAYSTGDRDISIQIVARDTRDMYTFVTETLGPLPGVRRTITSLVPKIIKDDARWKIPAAVIHKD
jgi:DNA-binding Lrp family transcriptional regulator